MSILVNVSMTSLYSQWLIAREIVVATRLKVDLMRCVSDVPRHRQTPWGAAKLLGHITFTRPISHCENIDDLTILVTFVMKISGKNSTLMISTSTSSWIRSRRRRDRIQLLVDVVIIVEFFPDIFITSDEDDHCHSSINVKISLNEDKMEGSGCEAMEYLRYISDIISISKSCAACIGSF